MYKKITSLMLAFLMCCFTIFAVSSGAEYTNAEALADGTEQSAGLLGAPDKILSASTADLLGYFLQTSFVTQAAYPSVNEDDEVNFSCHKAYRELVLREDCLGVLESYAANVLGGSKIDATTKANFEKLVVQRFVASSVFDPKNTDESYPNLRKMYTDIKNSLAVKSEYTATVQVSAEYAERLFGAPDEILSASTAELLEYFIETSFLRGTVLSCASTVEVYERQIDCSCHRAFRELVGREDCVEELEKYAERVLRDTKIGDFYKACFDDELDEASFECELDKACFEKLLAQPFIEALVFSEHNIDSYPSLQTMYADSDILPSSVGEYIGTIGGIDYYSAGTISTANGRSVEVTTPQHELPSDMVTGYNNRCDGYCSTRLSEPTAVYNCHSYAWYRFSTANPYWIMDISQFLLDSGCTKVATASAQVNDIIVYKNSDGQPIHSGVVYSISSSGELTIRSKWGQAGIYQHSIEEIPPEYCSYYGSGIANYDIYRYHDYENEATGNHYHSGGRHFYEYADVCKVCRKQINTTWRGVICDGPPCAVILAVQID